VNQGSSVSLLEDVIDEACSGKDELEGKIGGPPKNKGSW